MSGTVRLNYSGDTAFHSDSYINVSLFLFPYLLANDAQAKCNSYCFNYIVLINTNLTYSHCNSANSVTWFPVFFLCLKLKKFHPEGHLQHATILFHMQCLYAQCNLNTILISISTTSILVLSIKFISSLPLHWSKCQEHKFAIMQVQEEIMTDEDCFMNC